ncbi:MAG TPA: DNA-processing protein DprA [Chthonomonadales bacterium]|nr:DNA-processing protein DprA [Chthonomonadales bacterium]
MSPHNVEAWLRFANVQLQASMANALLDAFGDPEAVFSASPAAVGEVDGLTPRAINALRDPAFMPTAVQSARIESGDVCILPRTDPDYPQPLRGVPDAPPVLFVMGRLDERDRFAVGIVGTRQASPYGRSVTAKLARDLAQAGMTVVSGGALGIDAAAHRAALDAGGRTLVVLGCGIDVNYPRENRPMFDAVAARDQGAVLSEWPLTASPEPWRFPLRNRIISGLSMGVVVTEAPKQSGALITAGIAAEQGREVMAVPGNVDRPFSQGANELIRDGAHLVSSASDVLRVLNVLTLEPPASAQPVGTQTPSVSSLPEVQRVLMEHLSLTPKHLDALAADARLPTVEVSAQITMLELAGLVRRLPGNCYIRVL